MAYKGLFNYGFSWKIFGKTAQVGNRLKLKPSKNNRLAEMIEDDEGVYIFLPNADSVFYEGMDQEKVLEHTKSINSEIKKLADLGKDSEKKTKNIS